VWIDFIITDFAAQEKLIEVFDCENLARSCAPASCRSAANKVGISAAQAGSIHRYHAGDQFAN
jgi:hypothetical protein